MSHRFWPLAPTARWHIGTASMARLLECSMLLSMEKLTLWLSHKKASTSWPVARTSASRSGATTRECATSVVLATLAAFQR
jgi:hypothetical protein